MRRVKDERGAVSVMVALLMVVLVGFAALSVDVAGMWSQRQQLQTGADAGALAVAQDCAAGDCKLPTTTAQGYASQNVNATGITATILTPALSPTSGEVTVETAGVRQHAFAPVLGVQSTQLSAQATASWGRPSGGIAVLPLAFSWCEFLAQTGGGIPTTSTERLIKFTKTSGVVGCTGPSGNVVPGGFGWLNTDSNTTCHSTSAIDDTLYSSTGVAVPNGCTTDDFVALRNETVLLPLFDQGGDSGANAWYHVYGYAAFTITGYNFGGQYSWSMPASTCKGQDRCIRGYFTKFVSLAEAFTYSTSAPQLGTSVVTLTN